MCMRDDPFRAVGGGQRVKRPRSTDAWVGGERKGSDAQLKPKNSKTRPSDDQPLSNLDPRPDGRFVEGQDMTLNPRFDQF